MNYHFNERYFDHISANAKDFISRLFVRDVRKRATVDDCLRHPWIRIVGFSDVDVECVFKCIFGLFLALCYCFR